MDQALATALDSVLEAVSVCHPEESQSKAGCCDKMVGDAITTEEIDDQEEFGHVSVEQSRSKIGAKRNACKPCSLNIKL